MRTVGTQTQGTLLDHVQQVLVDSSCSTLVDLSPIKAQFWEHFLKCIKMPAGGVNAGGSMHCSFEFVAANNHVIQYLMEDLPLMAKARYNGSLPPPHWEPSPSISTYCALQASLIDSFFRLHRRPPLVAAASTAHRFWPVHHKGIQHRCASSRCPRRC